MFNVSVIAADRRDFRDVHASMTVMPSMFPWAITDCARLDVLAAFSQLVTAVTSDAPVFLTSGGCDSSCLVGQKVAAFDTA